MDGKFSWVKVTEEHSLSLGQNPYIVVHDNRNFIALTDTVEKAHFIATSANAFTMIEELKRQIAFLQDEIVRLHDPK